MSIQDEFKLKPIRRASYSPNIRNITKTSKGVVVNKATTRNDLSKRDKHLATVGKRKEKADRLLKIREDVMTWTVREVFEYLNQQQHKQSLTVANIVNNICKLKMEDE
tara:strand:+ start:1864 stop:2187 length:324 start_codon:yes stop_codon:yes gene_type:complete